MRDNELKQANSVSTASQANCPRVKSNICILVTNWHIFEYFALKVLNHHLLASYIWKIEKGEKKKSNERIVKPETCDLECEWQMFSRSYSLEWPIWESFINFQFIANNLGMFSLSFFFFWKKYVDTRTYWGIYK